MNLHVPEEVSRFETSSPGQPVQQLAEAESISLCDMHRFLLTVRRTRSISIELSCSFRGDRIWMCRYRNRYVVRTSGVLDPQGPIDHKRALHVRDGRSTLHISIHADS